MRKTRNFFLAVIGFFCLSVAFFIFSELVWAERGVSAAISATPRLAVEESISKDGPGWLVPHEEIMIYCDHPWVIRRSVALVNQSVDELFHAGLSECYEMAGEYAFFSHLWYQGIDLGMGSPSVPYEHEEEIELFFEYEADFEELGLKAPETTTLSGRVVHDLNGDAIFNPGEPVIPGAEICLNREPLAALCTRSDAGGAYSFSKLLPGIWLFRIFSPSIERMDEFRYTNQLIERDHHIPESMVNGHSITGRVLNLTEFNTIEDEIPILVEDDMEEDIFLMQEWATYFAAPSDADQFQIAAYYDLDLREGWTRNFKGEDGTTYDQHDGLDASCPTGTEIVSAAEGLVVAILYDSTVAIWHSNQLISVYGHGDPLVEENQFVPRGYPVALCNNNLTESGPHLHFAVWKNSPWMHRVIYGIPAFADLMIREEKWAANKDPLEEDHFVFLLQGGRGIWTEINQPHLPYVQFESE